MREQIRFEIVAFSSDAYKQTLKLRNDILRIPIGLELTEDECGEEYGDIHLAGFNYEKVVACMVLTPLTDSTMKMRQVAVSKDMQRIGIGQDMVVEAERICKDKKTKKIILHAREIVVPFYLKLGYKTTSETFIEVNMPHVQMEKIL